MKKEIIIYSKKLANYLIDSGYELLRTEININYPKFKVFVFKYDAEIDTILSEGKEK